MISDGGNGGTAGGSTGAEDDGDGPTASGSDGVDESGGQTEMLPTILYLTSGDPGAEFPAPRQLRAVLADGTEDRLLAELDRGVIRGFIVGVAQGRAFAFGDRNGIPPGQVVHAELDGTSPGVVDPVPAGLVWAHPDGAQILYATQSALIRTALDGSAEDELAQGGVWYLSPSRRFALASGGLYDLEGSLAMVPGDSVDLPGDGTGCAVTGYPGFWLDNEETRAFVYPGSDLTLLHRSLDGGAPTTMEIEAGWEPRGYDRCDGSLIGTGLDGAVARVGHDGTIDTLAPAVSPLEGSNWRFTPDGTRVTATTADGQARMVHIGNLVEGHWTTVVLPMGDGSLGNYATTDSFSLFVARPLDADPVAFRVPLLGGTYEEIPTCDAFSPTLLPDGAALLCGRDDAGLFAGVLPVDGGPLVPIARNAIEVQVIPPDDAPPPCIDTEPTWMTSFACP